MTNKSTHESIEAKLAKLNKGSGKGAAEKAEPEKTSAELPLDPVDSEEVMQRLNEAEQKASQHWDRILRMQADMENAARRAERELADTQKYVLGKFVNELLPVVDNLERAVTAAQDSPSDAPAILEGVHLTLKMLANALEKFGVKQVNPLHEDFNPLFHEAVSTQAGGTKPGQVLAVLQKGYLLNERLVRPAMVVVSK